MVAAQAQVQQADANVATAQLQLSYCTIVAPVTGRVAHRNVDVGNYVNPGQAMFALVQDELWVTANFKETQLADIRAGQPVDIDIDAIPSVTFHGRVDSFQPGTGSEFSVLPAENATGNYVKVVQRLPVKIDFDDDRVRNYQISPGMSVVPYVARALMADPSLPRSAAGNRSPWLIAVIVSIATFMEVLDVTIVNVALRHIAGSLATSLDESTWIVTSYLVSNADRAADQRLAGQRDRPQALLHDLRRDVHRAPRVMCAMSTSLSMMLIARVIQGIGGGGMAPTEQSIFADTFPAGEAGAGVRAVRPDGGHRAGGRPDTRRLADRQSVVALVLPDQPAGRAAVADAWCSCSSWSPRR